MQRNLSLSRWILTWISGAICALFLVAPLLVAEQRQFSAGLIYAFFAPICHQVHSRCFYLVGYPFAVCQRCAAIYIGILIGCLFYPLLSNTILCRVELRVWVLGAIVPMLVDVALSSLGLPLSTPLTRFATGSLFGSMVASLLIPAISEFLFEIADRHKCRGSSEMEGGRL